MPRQIPAAQADAAAVRQETAELLQTTVEKLPARLAGLGLGPVCGRCGGSGHHSYNQTDGTRCYGCSGTRVVPPKTAAQWRDTRAQAAAAVADGRLDRYLAFLRAQRVCKTATAQVLQAWKATGISNRYDWRKACERGPDGTHLFPEDRRLADANQLMANEYNRVERLAQALGSGTRTPEERQAMTIALADDVGRAVATIARIGELHLVTGGADPQLTALTCLAAAHDRTTSLAAYTELARRQCGLGTPFDQAFAELHDALAAGRRAASDGEGVEEALRALADLTVNSEASLLRVAEARDWQSLPWPYSAPPERDVAACTQGLTEALRAAETALDLGSEPSAPRR